MNKTKLIDALLDDCIEMFPESSISERMALVSRLLILDIVDLELLVSQVEKLKDGLND